MELRSFIIFIIIILGIIFCSSCEKSTLKEDPISEADSVKFARDIKPIFTVCVGCHDASRSPNLKDNPYQALKDGNYINVANPMQSPLYVQLKSDPMHSSKVSPDQLQAILQWIKQGARDN
jgi:hypothetical protein